MSKIVRVQNSEKMRRTIIKAFPPSGKERPPKEGRGEEAEEKEGEQPLIGLHSLSTDTVV